MTAIECPGCGAPAFDVDLTVRDVEDFCPKCDFPLFWAPSVTAEESLRASEGPLDPALRRRPGQAGLADPTGEPCPTCAELNARSAQVCVRCGAPMHPEPPAPPILVPPPPAPEPMVVEEPPLPEESDLSKLVPFLAIASCVILVIAALVAWLR